MKEKSLSWRKSVVKLFACIVLSVGVLLALEPAPSGAQSTQCGSNFNQCTNNCPYINTQQTLRDATCQSQCVGLSQNCISSGMGMEEGACGSVHGTCAGINASGGSDFQVGDCYSTYANCEYSQSQHRWAMLQQTPSEIPGYEPSCVSAAYDARESCLQGSVSECIVNSSEEVSTDCCWALWKVQLEGCRIS